MILVVLLEQEIKIRNKNKKDEKELSLAKTNVS